MKLSDYIADGQENDSYPYYSLLELSGGKKIKDILGRVSNEFGEPDFEIIRVVFEDGSSSGFGGEHDHPYLEDYGNKIIPEGLLDKNAELEE